MDINRVVTVLTLLSCLKMLSVCRQGCLYVGRVVDLLAGLLGFRQGCSSVGLVVIVLLCRQGCVLISVPSVGKNNNYF